MTMAITVAMATLTYHQDLLFAVSLPAAAAANLTAQSNFHTYTVFPKRIFTFPSLPFP